MELVLIIIIQEEWLIVWLHCFCYMFGSFKKLVFYEEIFHFHKNFAFKQICQKYRSENNEIFIYIPLLVHPFFITVV